MKKRLLAALLSLSMLATLIPSAAFAAGGWTYYPNRTWTPPGESEPYDYHDLLIRDGIYARVEAEEAGSTQLTLGGDAQKYPWPADVTEFDFNGTIQDTSGTTYTITYISSYPGRNILTKVTLPDTATSLGKNMAGTYCVVQEITLPASLEIIEDGALHNCFNLTTVNWNGARPTVLGSEAFAGCTALGSIALPDSVTSMGGSVFSGCAALTSVTLPSGLSRLSYNTFYGCASLAVVNIPAGVTTIERNVFNGCSALTQLTLPAGLTYIGSGAFDNCTSLESLTFQGATPPTLEEGYSIPGNFPIFVPEGSLEAYRQAWPGLAQRIWAIGDTPETYNFSMSASSLSFGEVVGGNLPGAQTITLTNTGSGDLTVTLPQSEKFTITAGQGFGGDTALIQPQGQASFTVQPKDLSAEGAVSETITVTAKPSNTAFADISASFTAGYTVKIPKITVGGVELGSGTGPVYALTDESGAVTTQGADQNNWNIRWDGADYTLTLKGANLSSQEKTAITARESLTLVLEGENLVSGAKGAVYVEGGLTIQGPGSLKADVEANGIRASGQLRIRDAALEIDAAQPEGESTILSVAIEAGGMTEISGSSLTLSSQETTALEVRGPLTVTDSTLNAQGNYGLRADSLTVDKASLLELYGRAEPLDANTITLDGQPFTDPITQARVRIQDGKLYQEMGSLYVGGVNILAPGAQIPQGVSYDPDTFTLTLSDARLPMGRVENLPAELGGAQGCGIYADGQLTIRLKGSSSITGQGGGILVIGDLTVEGPGSLEVDCRPSEPLPNISAAIMVSDGDFTLESGSLTLRAADAQAWNFGLYGDEVTIRGGQLNAYGATAHGIPENMGGISAGIYTGRFVQEGGSVLAQGGDVIGLAQPSAEPDPMKDGGLSAGLGTSNEVTLSGGYLTACSGRLLSGQGSTRAWLNENEKDFAIRPGSGEMGLEAGSSPQDAQPVNGSPFGQDTALSYDQLKDYAYLRSWVVGHAELALTTDAPADGAVYGQSVTCTAAVTSLDPDAPALSGQVEFWLQKGQEAPICLGQVALTEGKAVLSLDRSLLEAGDYSLRAEYTDAVYAAVTGTSQFQVVPRVLTWDTSDLTAARSGADAGAEAKIYGRPILVGVLEGDTVNLTLPASGLITQGLADKTQPGLYTVTAMPAAEGEGFALDNPNYTLPQTNPTFKAQILALVEGGQVQAPEGSDEDYKLEVTEGISKVPEALENDPALNTPQKIETRLKTLLTNTGIAGENMAVYDVKLLVSSDGGSTWKEADKDDFPAEGLTLTLPYPAGTGKDSHDFTVIHMFTTADFGKTPGDTETPAVTKTDAGIRFTVTGLSPIALGWQPVKAEPSDPGDGDTGEGGDSGSGSSDGSGSSSGGSGSSSGNSGSSGTAQTAATTQTGAPGTGDPARLGLWFALLLAGVGTLSLTARRRS